MQLEKQVGLDQIDAYVNTIVDEIMKELFKLKKLFKYAVTVFIQQKCGCAMNYGSKNLWLHLISINILLVLFYCFILIS